MAKHNELGELGEKIAQNLLIQKGYTVEAVNWRHGKWEIDIIAQKEGKLIFVEVKTRTSDAFGKPSAFVTPRKERLIVNAANAYMEKVKHFGEIRFDIIGVVVWSEERYEINHFEDAFFPGL